MTHISLSDIAFWQFKIAERLSLPLSDVAFRRLGDNALFDIPARIQIARLYRSRDRGTQAKRELQIAHALQRGGVPAIQSAWPHPMAIAGRVFTLWRRIDTVNRSPTAAELGECLRRFHSAMTDMPITTHPALDPPALLFQALDRINEKTVSTAVMQDLRRHTRIAESIWARFKTPVRFQIIHGDVRWENFIIDKTGQVYASDFDASLPGPVGWDLAPAFVRARRLGGHQRDCDDFLATYDALEPMKAGAARLARIREVLSVLHLARHAGSSCAYRLELEKRLDTLTSDPSGLTPLQGSDCWVSRGRPERSQFSF